jgi:predicted DNA-binding ribbon-helix-helix protein
MEQNNKISRTIRLNTRRTSIKMENVFWEALKKISTNEKYLLLKFVLSVDKNRKNLH